MERTVPPASKVTFPEAQLERYNRKHNGWSSARDGPDNCQEPSLHSEKSMATLKRCWGGLCTADSSVGTQNVLWGNLTKQRLGLLHQCKTAAALSVVLQLTDG